MRWLRFMLQTRRRLIRRVRELEHQLRLADSERASLERQVSAYRDFVDSFAWKRRAEGAEAKVYAESLRDRPDDRIVP